MPLQTQEQMPVCRLTQHSNVGEAWCELAKGIRKVLGDDTAAVADLVKSLYVSGQTALLSLTTDQPRTLDHKTYSTAFEDAARLPSATTVYPIP